MVANM